MSPRYAIVSADGMLADRNRKMPDGLKIEAQLWKPVGASFAEACRSIGVTEGIAAVTGGAEVLRL